MISVSEALNHLFALVRETGVETVPLRHAGGRVLVRDAVARLTQPPFAASAMDGYALRSGDVSSGAVLDVIGESAAGRRFQGSVASGQAVRIFTGAPMPESCDRVVIQEDVTRTADSITLGDNLDAVSHVRPAGGDFTKGDRITAPRRLGPSDIALLAAMNVDRVDVARRPVVAILATGDELVQPGEDPGPDQIVASNSYGLAAQIEAAGGIARLLPIARDTAASLEVAFDLAAGADLILTIGGASVGDYDLVGQVTESLGMERAFYKVAMRPGKPLMAGRLGGAMVIGLPGNPVSAMVCGTVFVRPVLDAFMGLPACAARRISRPLAAPLAANGPREHYMRGLDAQGGVTAFDRQDSALLTVLASADCLIIRPPNDPARRKGETVEILKI